MLLNGDHGLGGQLLLLGLRQRDLQDAVLEFALHVLGADALADVEAPAHRTGVTLLTDVFAVLLLILIEALRGLNGQVTRCV